MGELSPKSRLGYNATTFKSAAEAIEYYRVSWKEIDVVFLDMMMPNIGGRDTFLAMKEVNPDVKVILSSGYGFNQEVSESLDNGALFFLRKPLGVGELERKIAEAIRR